MRVASHNGVNEVMSMTKLKDETGNRYGKLVVLYMANDKVYASGRSTVMWHCKCDCCNECDIAAGSLRNGLTKSCGCLNYEMMKNCEIKYSKHHLSGTRLYDCWRCMKRRCYEKSRHNYKDYGGRGITVCDEWLKDFKNFADWALLNGYSDELTLDRINVNGNYEPSNCRWATNKDQQRNKRNTHYITYQGVTRCLAEWAEVTGNSKDHIRYYEKLGDIEKALTPIAKDNGSKVRNDIM